MVLLQSDSSGRFRYIYWFTFQYGSTSIFSFLNCHHSSSHLHSNMVLLQSGCDHTVSCAFEIYIPIWFYFNSTSAVRSIFKVLIYIPIWFYFNTTRRLNILSWRHLHSNMVLLQSYQPEPFRFPSAFTFQYGSTSMATSISLRMNMYDLHSNMVLLQSRTSTTWTIS